VSVCVCVLKACDWVASFSKNHEDIKRLIERGFYKTGIQGRLPVPLWSLHRRLRELLADVDEPTIIDKSEEARQRVEEEVKLSWLRPFQRKTQEQYQLAECDLDGLYDYGSAVAAEDFFVPSPNLTLFKCLAEVLYKDERKCKDVLKALIKYVEEGKQVVIEFDANDTPVMMHDWIRKYAGIPWSDWRNFMKRASKEGDTMHILLAARCFNLSILHVREGEQYQHTFPNVGPNEPVAPPQASICLAYCQPNQLLNTKAHSYCLRLKWPDHADMQAFCGFLSKDAVEDEKAEQPDEKNGNVANGDNAVDDVDMQPVVQVNRVGEQVDGGDGDVEMQPAEEKQAGNDVAVHIGGDDDIAANDVPIRRCCC